MLSSEATASPAHTHEIYPSIYRDFAIETEQNTDFTVHRMPNLTEPVLQGTEYTCTVHMLLPWQKMYESSVISNCFHLVFFSITVRLPLIKLNSSNTDASH